MTGSAVGRLIMLSLAASAVGLATTAKAASADSAQMGAWMVGESGRVAPGGDVRCDPGDTTIMAGESPEHGRRRFQDIISACTGVIDGGRSSADAGLSLRVRAMAY